MNDYTTKTHPHPDPKPFYFSLADLFKFNPRLEQRIDTVENCWLWNGYSYAGKSKTKRELYPHGWWGRFSKRTGLMHRFTYMLAWGEHSIPDGYELHHECGQSLCINPNHLAAVSKSLHILIHMGQYYYHPDPYPEPEWDIISPERT